MENESSSGTTLTNLFKIFLCAAFISVAPPHAAAATHQCDRFSEALTQALGEKNPRLTPAIDRAKREIAKLPPMLRRRILAEIENVKGQSTVYEGYGTVRSTHSLAALVVNILLSQDRFSTALEYFLGGRERPDGLYLSRETGNHPLREIVLLHELSHMSRMYTWLGWQSNRAMLRMKLTKDGMVKEEKLAISDEYDHIRSIYTVEDLPALKARYPFSQEAGEDDFWEGVGALSANFTAKNAEWVNYSFITKVEGALTTSREEYIEDTLTRLSYYDNQNRQNASLAAQTGLMRVLVRISTLLFP